MEKDIVHRVISVNETDGTVVTKGDNNAVSDAHFLYKDRLPREKVFGRVWLTIPYIGRPFTWFLENSYLKYGAITLSVLWDIFV